MNIDVLDEFVEMFDVLDNEHNMRVPKRYVRDAANPLEFFSNFEFKRRYRFTKDSVVNVLLPLVDIPLRTPNSRGLPIDPIIQLLTCLRFYATGNFQMVAGDLRGISQPTVSRMIKRVSENIAAQLGQYVQLPQNVVEQRSNIRRFHAIAGFPGVAGCVDCTHIAIASPGGDNAEVFRNRKGFFSLNVQVAVDPHMRMLDVVVRHPGSAHDSLIFDRSALRVQCEQGRLGGLLLGDNGYTCRTYLLTPVIRPGNVREERYNRAHRRTRNIVERVFGVWKRRFPCLRRQLNTKLETSQTIICACAVLHNISMQVHDRWEENADENEAREPQRNVDQNQIGLVFRRQFINRHFN